MKRCIAFLSTLIMLFLVACDANPGNNQESNPPEALYSADEQSAMRHFETLYAAVKTDTSGTYSEIKTGTDAHAAIVAIEKLYKANTQSRIITQIYYYAEVISGIEVSSVFSDSKYFEQAMIYAKQIDQSYDGPYADEIIQLAKKYTSNSDESSKSALTMTASEKADVKAFINSRYDYYDKINGGYAGDKYTEQIWKETAEKFGISTADVDLIWYDR